VVAWIGCGGKVALPPLLPVLTPLDFSVWGYVKHKVFFLLFLKVWKNYGH